jgi:hypothetical protein
MENLFKNDSSFELYQNLDGAEILHQNRVLMEYPSEKSSFDVFLGFQGDEDDSKKVSTKIDTEKFTEGLVATAGAIGAIGATAQAFKGDGTKAPSRRKELKQVCGRKPILKKNRGTYDKCVSDYNAGKIGSVTFQKNEPQFSQNDETPSPTTNNTKRNVIIGVVAVGLIVTAIFAYKKGWFGNKVS